MNIYKSFSVKELKNISGNTLEKIKLGIRIIGSINCGDSNYNGIEIGNDLREFTSEKLSKLK